MSSGDALLVKVRPEFLQRVREFGPHRLQAETGLSEGVLVALAKGHRTLQLSSLAALCRAMDIHPEDAAEDPRDVWPLTRPWLEWDLDGFMAFLARKPCYRDDPRFAPYRDRPLPGPVPEWDTGRSDSRPPAQQVQDEDRGAWVCFTLRGERADARTHNMARALARLGVRIAQRVIAPDLGQLWVLDDERGLELARSKATCYDAEEGKTRMPAPPKIKPKNKPRAR